MMDLRAQLECLSVQYGLKDTRELPLLRLLDDMIKALEALDDKVDPKSPLP